MHTAFTDSLGSSLVLEFLNIAVEEGRLRIESLVVYKIVTVCFTTVLRQRRIHCLARLMKQDEVDSLKQKLRDVNQVLPYLEYNKLF